MKIKFLARTLVGLFLSFQSVLPGVAQPMPEEEQALSIQNSVEIRKIIDKIEAFEKALMDAEADASTLIILKEKLSWIERELTNSLMDISNVLDVSGANMDAAHAAIEASQSAVGTSEAYLTTGSYIAAAIGVFVALSAIGAVIMIESTNRKIRGMASAAADDIINEFVSSSNDSHNHGTRKVLEAVRESVKQDLEETPALLMQNDEFKKMLKRLVEAAVKAKPSGAPVEKTMTSLDADDFSK